ncbi:hypothetical protein [Planktothrix mougeotii]|uniref:Uncharacterized protein n=1 Tax=Planktothrix mougeotii LEGE 06226 TaxID=1828728 RepID=A0ABR9UGU2_9CYAN|nr:hypothetical protein [Planktothrix mougeotii]MBE9145685.1 hypothetical protein [Planktothrix mougeotii LEGE 06226]
MLTLLLSSIVNGSILLPANFENAGLGVYSIVKRPQTSQPFIILSQIQKTGEDDPIVPPN